MGAHPLHLPRGGCAFGSPLRGDNTTPVAARTTTPQRIALGRHAANDLASELAAELDPFWPTQACGAPEILGENRKEDKISKNT